MTPEPAKRTVVLVTAPAVIEEWLDPLGVSYEQFRTELTGGWMFNYVEALAKVGVSLVLVCFSEWVREPESFVHTPTGATVWMVPPARRHSRMRRWIGIPATQGARDPASLGRGVLRHLAPYGLTPLAPLRRILARERADAILSQDYTSQRFDLCLALGRALRRPVFATFQGGFFPPSWFTHAVRPYAVRAASGLIVASSEERERLEREYRVPPDKIVPIPNPLDVSEWQAVSRAKAREALGIPGDARVAITHGRIDIRDKGLDVLLEAWERVMAKRPDRDVRLLMVGAGGDVERVRSMLTTDAYPGAQLVDRFIVDPTELRRHLSAADVFAFAGRFEGFPVAPVEAMACSLGAVATEAQGIRDIFDRGEQSGGIVVPRDDPGALAEQLGRVLDDGHLAQELGRRARRRVEDYCSLETVGRELDAFMTARGLRQPLS